MTGRGARGFSLIEVMIVVIILGILAAVVVPQFTTAANDARNGSIASQARTIELQLELYRARFGVFPTQALMAAVPTDATLGAGFGILVDNGYIKTAPANPYSGGSAVPADWVYNEVTGVITAVIPGE